MTEPAAPDAQAPDAQAPDAQAPDAQVASSGSYDAREGSGDPETDPAAVGETSFATPDGDGGAVKDDTAP